MSEPRTPLARARLESGHVIRIAERGPVGQVTLRADLADRAVARAVEKAAGVAVPERLSARFEGARAAVWMAPDELLLLCAYDEAPALVAALDEALTGTHHLALDVSDARVVFALEGARVAEVLAKGAPVDLAPAAFPVGRARRTHLAGVAAAFWRRAESEWELVCFRSVARHVFDWLAQASREGSAVGAF